MELGRYTVNTVNNGAQVPFCPPTGAEWLSAGHNLEGSKEAGGQGQEGCCSVLDSPL